ncbi:MAG: hydroxyacid dehydrogenase [Rhodospirillales bacterium]
MSNKYRLLLPDMFSEAAWALVRERSDVEAESFPGNIAPEELHKRLPGVHGIALGGTPFRAPELAAAPQMKAVARIGVGYDAVDTVALSARGIPLLTTDIANSPSVAEQALFFMLTLAKRGAALHALVSEGRWMQRNEHLPSDLLGKTVLVVGCGRIGSRTVKRCVAMEMDVLVYDPYVSADAVKALGATAVSDLDAAVARADFVTIHCPKSKETLNLFDAARLARMKPTAFLINTARGGLVDEAALHAALDSGKLAGAGLDVFDAEPPRTDNKLFKLPNVITAPHVAGVTREAFDRMCVRSVRNLLSVFDGVPDPLYVVNKDYQGKA